MQISFTINGKPVTVDVPPARPLLDTLRDELHLTGSKECCGKGECGSCTVVLDGEAVCSCLVLTAQAEGRHIVTVEGVGRDGRLDPVQEAFVEHGAPQCGYCIPGLIVMARNFLDQNPEPTVEEIKDGIAGNLCRCTGYQKIVQAIAAAAEKMRTEVKEVG
jgi:aerobic-type carbon monoxide dehydrogenase small subunit (CoxS/CutS family)